MRKIGLERHFSRNAYDEKNNVAASVCEEEPLGLRSRSKLDVHRHTHRKNKRERHTDRRQGQHRDRLSEM